MKRRLIALVLVAMPVFCASNGNSRPSAISLRKRLHINPLITDPDTIEFDWGGAFSVNGPWSLPATIRYTPEGHHLYLGRTEFSANFDSAHLDHAVMAATCVVHDGEKFDVALAPLLSVPMRDGSPVRVGGLAITRFDLGRNNFGFTGTWLANTLDVGAGYGHRFGKQWTPHMNWQWEKAGGTNRQVSIYEGIEYQVTDPFAIDVSAQHQNVWGGHRDTQLVVGLTFATGHLHRH